MTYYIYETTTGTVVGKTESDEQRDAFLTEDGRSSIQSEQDFDVWDCMYRDGAIVLNQAAINQEKITKKRQERNELLRSLVDPIVSNPLRWASLTDAQQAEWVTYRQELLDITMNSSFPNVQFPDAPTE